MAKALVTKAPKHTAGASTGSPKIVLLLSILATVFFILTLLLSFMLFKNGPVPQDQVKAKVATFGEVVSSEPLGDTGMTAWVLKPKGTNQNAIFYSTKDGKAFIDGTIFNIADGKDLTTPLLAKNNIAPATAPNTDPQTVTATPVSATGHPTPEQVVTQSTEGEPLGEFKGTVPEVIKVLDSMPGYKEDKSMKPEDTVYVVYDPRCPYCHKLYEMTRNVDFKGKNITIKWLPTVALGQSNGKDEIARQAAFAFEAKDGADFGCTFSQEKPLAAKFGDQETQALGLNLSLLYEAADKTYGKDAPKAVPAVFYLNKKNGLPKMIYGSTDPAVFKIIFGS